MSALPTLICPVDGQTHSLAEWTGQFVDWGTDNQGVLETISAEVFRAWWLNAKEIEVTFSRTYGATYLEGTATFRRSNGQVLPPTEVAWVENFPPPSIDASTFAFGSIQALDMCSRLGWVQVSGSGTYDNGSGPVAATVSTEIPLPFVMARPKDDAYRAQLYRFRTYVSSGITIGVLSSASATLGSNTSAESYSVDTTSFTFDHTDNSSVATTIAATITDTFY